MQTVPICTACTVAASAASTIFICRIYTTSHFALVVVVVAASFISCICHPHAAHRGNSQHTLSWHKHLRVGVLFLAHAPVQAAQCN